MLSFSVVSSSISDCTLHATHRYQHTAAFIQGATAAKEANEDYDTTNGHQEVRQVL
jgi:hypothetical protein